MVLSQINDYADLALTAFEKRCADALAVNAATLRDIVQRNGQTHFGRAHGLGGVAQASDREYANRVPLSQYSDYTGYIDSIAAGTPHVLCADPIEFFAGTSGTTCALKLIPKTAHARRVSAEFMGIISRAVVNRTIPGINPEARGLNLMSAYRPPERWHGRVPIGASTNAAVGGFGDYIPLLWCSPPAVYGLADDKAATYLHALFGLATPDISYIEAIFATQMTVWFEHLFAQQDALLEDIRLGRVSPQLDIDDSLRKVLDAILHPAPERAVELVRVFRAGQEGFIRRAWPKIRFLSTVVTGSFSIAAARLHHLSGRALPITSKALTASESMVGVQLQPDTDEFVLAVGTAYFEFIAEAELERAHPLTTALADVEVGRRYEVVVTTRAGLYRYRLGDVIEITGFHGRAPCFRFCYRQGVVLNLVGEKTNEAQLRAAVTLATASQPRLHAAATNYVATGQLDRGIAHYSLYVEFASHDRSTHTDIETFAARLDKALRTTNPCYDTLGRACGRLAPAQVQCIATGTLANAFAGASSTRAIKIPDICAPGTLLAQRLAGRLLPT